MADTQADPQAGAAGDTETVVAGGRETVAVVDAQRVAAAYLALGRRLAGWRRSVGLTQQALAVQVQYARSSLANIETGKQRGTVAFWSRADQVVGAQGALLATFNDVERLRLRRYRPVVGTAGVPDFPTTAVPLAAVRFAGDTPLALVKDTLIRQLRTFAGMPAHQPTRPAWRCTTCARPWPCSTRRTELLVSRGEDIGWLTMYMGLYLGDAITDLCHDTADLHRIVARFLGWLTGPTTNPAHHDDVTALITRLHPGNAGAGVAPPSEQRSA